MVWSLRPEMGKAVNRLSDAAYNKSTLPVRVREAARMRIAQLNQCVVCMGFRAESVQRQGLTEDFYEHVAEYHADDRYSAARASRHRVRRTLRARPHEHRQAFIDRLREQFDDGEILDLTVCLAAFLGLGRVLNVLGIEETCLVDVYAPSERGAPVNS